MKKLISFILLAVIVMSVASCATGQSGITTAVGKTEAPTTQKTPSTGDSSEAQTPASQSGTTQSPVTQASIDMEAVYDAYDLGSKTYSIMCLQEDPANGTIVNRYNQFTAEEDDGDQITAALFMRQKKVEELFGCKIETITDGCTRTNVGVKLKEQIDIGNSEICAALVGGYTLKDVFAKNNLYDLREISTVNLDEEWWNKQLTEDLTVNGKTYAAGGDISIRHMLSFATVFFNKKLVERDIPDVDLYQMVRNKEWTMDNLIKYSQLLTKEIDGNDTIDENDQVGFVSETAYLQFYINAAGEYAFKNTGDTLVYNLPNNEKAERMATKFYELWKGDFSLNIKDFTDDSVGAIRNFMNDNVGFYSTQMLYALNFRAMESDFGLLPLPLLDETQDDYHSTQSYYFSGFMVIPITYKDPETAGALVDALAYYGHKYNRQAVYEYSYESMKVLRDEGSVEMFNLILDKQMTDLAWLYDMDSLRNTIAGFATSNTYASTMKKGASSISKKLSNLLTDTFDIPQN